MVLLPEMGERCTFRDDDDCSFSFSYKENPGKDVTISVQREKGTHYVVLSYVTFRFHYLALRYFTLHCILTLLTSQSALFLVRELSSFLRCNPQAFILV